MSYYSTILILNVSTCVLIGFPCLSLSLSASCSFHPQSILYCAIDLHVLSHSAFRCHLPWAQSLDSNIESRGNSYEMRERDPWTDVLGIETEVRSPLVRGLAEAS